MIRRSKLRCKNVFIYNGYSIHSYICYPQLIMMKEEGRDSWIGKIDEEQG